MMWGQGSRMLETKRMEDGVQSDGDKLTGGKSKR